MKKFNFLLILLFTINLVSHSQDSFYRIYKSSFSDYSLDVCQTQDKGYIIVGKARNKNNNDDIYVIKTNQSGDTLWTKLIDNNGFDYGYSIKQTSDSGYIIAGTTYSLKGELMYLVRLSKNGEIIWSKDYGGSDNNGNAGGHVEITDDDGFIILSYNYLRKTDSNGDTLWTKTLDYGLNDRYGLDMCVTTDGGYIITGNGIWDGFLAKTDSGGNIIWSKTYNYFVANTCESVKEAPDGGYIIVGTAYSYHSNGSYNGDILVIKTNNLGDTLWTKTFGTDYDDYGYSVNKTIDGEFIISGASPDPDPQITTTYDIYLIKINSLGDTSWTKKYDFLKHEFGNSVKQTSDSGYIVTGHIEYEGSFNNDIFLLKTDKDGNTNGLPIIIQPSSINSQENDKNINIYPNPINDVLNIQRNDNSEVFIEIYDYKGMCIYEKSHTDCFVRIDFSKYYSGIYVLKLRSNSSIFTKLIIKSNYN